MHAHQQGQGAAHGTALGDDLARLRSQMRAAVARIRALEAQKAEAARQLASASWAAGALGEQPSGSMRRSSSGQEDSAAGRQDDAHACAVEAKIVRLARLLQLRTKQLQVGRAQRAHALLCAVQASRTRIGTYYSNTT